MWVSVSQYMRRRIFMRIKAHDKASPRGGQTILSLLATVADVISARPQLRNTLRPRAQGAFATHQQQTYYPATTLVEIHIWLHAKN
jgi:hypothetical protein